VFLLSKFMFPFRESYVLEHWPAGFRFFFKVRDVPEAEAYDLLFWFGIAWPPLFFPPPSPSSSHGDRLSWREKGSSDRGQCVGTPPHEPRATISPRSLPPSADEFLVGQLRPSMFGSDFSILSLLMPGLEFSSTNYLVLAVHCSVCFISA